MTGVLRGTVSGPNWISGGEFGVEASWIAVAVCLIATAVILRLVVQRGLVKAPFWKLNVGVDGNPPALVDQL